jgi:hypothetical protein
MMIELPAARVGGEQVLDALDENGEIEKRAAPYLVI